MSTLRLNKSWPLGIALAALALVATPALAQSHQWKGERHRHPEVLVEKPYQCRRPPARYWVPSHPDRLQRHHRYERVPDYGYPYGRDRSDRWSRDDRYEGYRDRWARIRSE